MAKPIVLSLGGQESKFSHKRVDRAKLYGRRQRVPLDPAQQRCKRAELTDDGAVLVRTGMTAQGHFDAEDRFVPRSELVGLDAEGKPLELVKSTLGVAQELKRAEPEELLDLSVISVYMLDPVEVTDELAAELKQGTLFRFRFNYRDDFNAETAFLVSNADGTFAIIGDPVTPEWSQLEQLAEEKYEETGDPDDLDFEMF